MPTNIAIHSVPRSGSSWLGEIINSSPDVIYSYQPLFSYPFKGALSTSSTGKDVDDFFDHISKTDDEFIRQSKERKQLTKPVFKKESPTISVYKEVRYHHIVEHILLSSKNTKVVGLIRNPLAVLCSWISAPREFRADLGWDFEKEWRTAASKNLNRPEEFFGFNKWKEVALLFHRLQKTYPDNFYLVEYSDLLNDCELQVRQLFSFLGLTYTKQTHLFIQNKLGENSTKSVYSVFNTKERDDNWKSVLNENIVQSIVHELEGTDLMKYID